jgi:DNA repair exonuclease SbcCD ATPase subunit
MVNEKNDAILDEAKEKLLEEAYKKSWKNMKYMLSKMENLKETYDKWSAYYEAANEKYEKLKAAYEKMKDIQEKLNKIDKLWKEWKLDSWKVEVLKWSILLWEWLEYATWYVPVFWSTISTITKETFWVVNKFATKRAIRTTSIDKCIEDPANCDTDWISWY